MSNSQTDMAEALADALSDLLTTCHNIEDGTTGVVHVACETLAAYRSAQQAEAGAAGDLPPLPSHDIWGGIGHSEDQLRTYGQQCYEAGRQHGFQQGRALARESPAEAFERGRRQGMEQARADQKCPRHGAWMCVACRRGEAPAASSAQEPEISGKVVDWEAEHRRLRHENNKLRNANQRLTVFCANALGMVGFVNPNLAIMVHLMKALGRPQEEIQKAHAELKVALSSHPARLAGAAQGEAVAPGTLGGRFLGFLAELERRFPDPEPISARAYEGRFLEWLDALMAHPQAQVERKPLTRSVINKLSGEAQTAFCLCKQPTYEVAFARAIEAAHGIPTASTASDEGSV